MCGETETGFQIMVKKVKEDRVNERQYVYVYVSPCIILCVMRLCSLVRVTQLCACHVLIPLVRYCFFAGNQRETQIFPARQEHASEISLEKYARASYLPSCVSFGSYFTAVRTPYKSWVQRRKLRRNLAIHKFAGSDPGSFQLKT
jgi:hypothetical protein